MNAYVPAYKDPDFAQSLPEGPAWELTDDHARFGALRYRDPATGVEAVVPNIWYNQPVSWRIKSTRFSLARLRENIARKREEMKPWTDHEMAELERSAAQLERLILAMERSGRPMSIDPVTGEPR